MAVGIHHVSGPLIADLRRRLNVVQDGPLRARVAQQLAEEARTQVANGFRSERNPYGEAWAPLERRRGKILRRTGRMAASVATSQVDAGFQLEITAAYSKYHQYGTKKHQRAARIARQSARGRFVGRRARTAYLLKIRAHTNPGIPQRQMVPMATTGGLGPIWGAAFDETTRRTIDATLRGR